MGKETEEGQMLIPGDFNQVQGAQLDRTTHHKAAPREWLAL